ncbi:HCNGP-like protein-domain-containing protein [Leucosporidium creatinivorum]|uniref:HCNGP-like protein-domain-containing protein n=1 Tax=Leucosporidium creatinivorum TaxID=106004 RepID=A0A1Y2G378_9BASI|nr:HCNGP-like protein-domain-containing protein [Leucosporidium creatinivorum]
MQSLASYGSDSDEEPVASSSALPRAEPNPTPAPEPAVTAPSPASIPSQPSITRIKGTGSRAPSPLSGVKLPSSTSSPRPLPGSPTKQAKGKQRELSASPPSMARGAPTEDRSSESTIGGGSRTGAGGEQGGVGVLGVRMDSLAEFGVPPMVAGPCSPSLEAKIAQFDHMARTRGLHFNDSLSRSKAFRNPRIHSTLVKMMNVDEAATNWDKAIWDPKGLNAEGTASRIAEMQRLHSEARQAGQAAGSRSSIAFAPSSSSAPPSMHDRVDEQARIRDSLASKASSSSRSHHGGHREKERERERDRDRDGGRGERKRSRWDSGAGGGKRERSKSPARRH